MKRKFMLLMMVLTLFVGTIPVSADTYNAEGDADVPVTATVGETFVVGLPTSVTLTKQPNGSYAGSFVKQAYGDISGVSTLSVTPNDEDNETDGIQVQLTATSGLLNKNAMCTVTDAKTTYDYQDLATNTVLSEVNYQGTATTVSITKDTLSSGNWEGVLTYTISLD